MPDSSLSYLPLVVLKLLILTYSYSLRILRTSSMTINSRTGILIARSLLLKSILISNFGSKILMLLFVGLLLQSATKTITTIQSLANTNFRIANYITKQRSNATAGK